MWYFAGICLYRYGANVKCGIMHILNECFVHFESVVVVVFPGKVIINIRDVTKAYCKLA